jgi:glycosyltransferase involved in cell wall biosynthesis
LRLAVLASHPVQYQAPLFRALAKRVELKVFFAHRASPRDQAKAGFGTGFDWDVDLLQGYPHHFLYNVSRRPGLDSFKGCDTPEVGAQLRDGGFEALLVQGWHLKAYCQGIVAAKRQGIPVVVRGDSHLGTPRSLAVRTAKAIGYPLVMRLFDAALFVGERSRAYWLNYRYPASRLFFSPHCVDTVWFGERATAQARATLRNRLGISPDAKLALFAGKLMESKRACDLVAAAVILKGQDRNVGIVVAGSGPAEKELLAAAAGAKIDIYPLGFRNQSEMPGIYAASDFLVLPSENETWGLVANESIACGRPIVVADAVGCAPDLALDGSAGRVFPTGNPAALAHAMVEMIDHPPTLAAIAAKSKAYSVDVAAAGIAEALWKTSSFLKRQRS